MTPEEGVQQMLSIGEQMKSCDRSVFFQLIAAASIAFIRGDQGEEVLTGFVYAAMKSNDVLSLEDPGNRIN